MRIRNPIIVMIFTLLSFASMVSPAFSEPIVSIIMEKTTYTYCEKLFYTIEVSEITGDPAIIHIRDETGKGSSAIPIEITKLQNPIPSLIAFQEEIFPLGKYFIDVQYSDAKTSIEFDLIDSDKICVPEVIKPIMSSWLSGNISDGFLIDAFQKYVDERLIIVPFEINEGNVYDINVPSWVKNIGQWWIQGIISDEEFAQCVNYLIDKNMISVIVETGMGTSIQ